ncbi:hypothetical protein ACFWCF_01995 [Rhodococcus sp. NPDC060090]|uniref:hypothetical protein n=1 Tax=Rhodococcus sp. NPDC060090 TaxID=3347056 RepID=UPI00365B8782
MTATGHIEFDSPWWTQQTATPVDVVARLSGGVGTPTGVPDVLGLALKIPLEAPDAHWDLLLASSGTATVTRLFPLPVQNWPDARYSTLMPYSSKGTELRWIVAIPEGAHPRSTTLEALRSALIHAPLSFRLELVSFSGTSVPAGRLTLTQVLELPDDEQPSFDPVLNRAPDVVLRPEWLAGIRVGAYRGSRRGRGEPPR